MKNWIVPVVCLMLVTGGGCGEKPSPKDAGYEPKSRQIDFASVNINRAPSGVRTAAEKNKTRETAGLYEEEGNFWVLLTRGQKPTGGYGIRITGVYLEESKNQAGRLKVIYEYIDPGPGQFVTQVLTYPVELVLLKGLKEKPGNVSYIKEPGN